MRVDFLQSIDFNQMLVYSTFVHLLFLTLVMFLPGPRTQEQIVVPTFRLDLIELSPAVQPAPAPNKKQEVALAPVKKKAISKVKPIAKKLKKQKIKKPVLKSKAKQSPPPKPVIKESKLAPKAKQLPPPKPVIRESEARKKILAGLESLESVQPKRSVLKELDRLARIPPEAMQPLELPLEPEQAKPLPPKAVQEETFREIERKKAPELPLESEQAKPFPPKAIQPLEPEQAKPLPRVDDFEVNARERELAKLSEQSVELDSNQKTQTKSDLITELETMEKKKIHPADILVEENQLGEFNSSPAFNNIKGESLASVVDKINELGGSPEEIKIDISQGRMVLREFKTTIQRSEVLVPKMDSELEASNVLSLYVGEIYKRIYSHWKTPLGSKFKDVVVSFVIFSKGNIDNPAVRESTGDKNLDSIAVRAILDSVPFPTLPEELHRPNLPVNIVFRYVPEKK